MMTLLLYPHLLYNTNEVKDFQIKLIKMNNIQMILNYCTVDIDSLINALYSIPILSHFLGIVPYCPNVPLSVLSSFQQWNVSDILIVIV